MTLPVMSTGDSGLRFRLLGVPVRIDPSFFVIFVLFGFIDGLSLLFIAVWVAVAGVSILAHEMGHALLARSTGAAPVIALHGMGGLTSWSGQHQVSRPRMIGISAAGPAAGIVLGLLLREAHRRGVGAESELVSFALVQGAWVGLAWGLLNLLPILPLDGGQIMRDLLPGSEPRRERIAAIVSVVVATAAAAVGFLVDRPIAAIFAAFFALTNLQAARGDRPRAVPPDVAALHEAQRFMQEGSVEAGVDLARRVTERGDTPAAQQAAAQIAASGLLALGRAAEAKALLLDLPAGSVDPVLEAQVLAATGQVELAVERLAAIHAAKPDQTSAYVLAHTLASHGRGGDVPAYLGGESVPSELLSAAAEGAEAGGAPDVADRLRAGIPAS